MTDEKKIGPPPWSEAPAWAVMRAMHPDGIWSYFHSTTLEVDGDGWVTPVPMGGQAIGYQGDSLGRNWISTAETRPTDTDDDWPGHVSPCAMHAAEQGDVDPETQRLFAKAVQSGDVTVTEEVPGYESLRKVLDDAYDQAARGKGKERHGNGQPFDQQPMQHLIADHGLGFATGQAAKKSGEALGMGRDAARRELLGAIVYLAGAIVWMDRQEEE